MSSWFIIKPRLQSREFVRLPQVEAPTGCNSSNHTLANFGRTQGHTVVWLGSGPEVVLDAVSRD